MSLVRKIEPLKILKNSCYSLESVASASLFAPDKLPDFIPSGHVIHKYRKSYKKDDGREQDVARFPLRLSKKECHDGQRPVRAESQKAAPNQRGKGQQRQQHHCEP